MAIEHPENKKGGFERNIIYKWWICHCHVWLPEGIYTNVKTYVASAIAWRGIHSYLNISCDRTGDSFGGRERSCNEPRSNSHTEAKHLKRVKFHISSIQTILYVCNVISLIPIIQPISIQLFHSISFFLRFMVWHQDPSFRTCDRRP